MGYLHGFLFLMGLWKAVDAWRLEEGPLHLLTGFALMAGSAYFIVEARRRKKRLAEVTLPKEVDRNGP